MDGYSYDMYETQDQSIHGTTEGRAGVLNGYDV